MGKTVRLTIRWARIRRRSARPSRRLRLGSRFATGAFVGIHGSWNREDPVGYEVVFVSFRNRRPNSAPIDFVIGFQSGGATFGRSVSVSADPRAL